MSRKSNKVLLIGWDAADWKVIKPLLDEGKMPHLQKLIDNGIMGNLATLRPELSPMLWTSIATGKRPYKHGVLGFTEPDPEGQGVRPVSSLSRRGKAIWNILNQQGLKSVVVGWWPSHPVEPIDGVMVSNHYQRAVALFNKPWPMAGGTVHPKRLVGNLAALRTHPQELDPGLISLFLPGLHEIDQEKNRRVESLAKIIADATTIKNAMCAILKHEPWDFGAVYFDAIDHFCHGFMDFHPPRLKRVKEEDYELYKEVVSSGYRLHDVYLGALLEAAGDDVTTIIVSDHGFHSDHLRPARLPKEPAGPAAQHRPYGIFLAHGPGIKKDELIYGASLLDICPTILTLYDLPIGDDMDGKPLVNIFSKAPTIKTVAGWDSIAGPYGDGCHAESMRLDPAAAREAVQQLVDLGYIEEPDADKEKAAENAVREMRYNEARSYMDAGLHIEALPLLEELLREWPFEYRFGIQMAFCHLALDRPQDARPGLEKILARRRKRALEARAEIDEFRKKHGDAMQEGSLSKEQWHEWRNLVSDANQNPYAVEFLLATMLLAEGDEASALKHLKKAQKADSGQPILYLKLGEVYEKMKRFSSAERAYSKVLELDHEVPEALLGLSRTALAGKKNQTAAHFALDAMALRFHQPEAHYLLGWALHRLNEIPRAVQALKTAVAQNPNYPQAYLRLAYIYKKRLHLMPEAEACRQQAKEARRRLRDLKSGKVNDSERVAVRAEAARSSDQEISGAEKFSPEPFVPGKTILIVSGLPRSGTSMMMQMLAAGGRPLLVDDHRPADDDNPKGYFEFIKARKLRQDDSWLTDAHGKTVKIVTQLLHHLPSQSEDLKYHVIMMHRDDDEVLASQARMLENRQRQGGRLPDKVLKEVFRKQVARTKLFLATRKIPLLAIKYQDCLADPLATARMVNEFLGQSLEPEMMAAAVDKQLYRQKNSLLS